MKKNEHGGGQVGISRCGCELCRAKRRDHRRQQRNVQTFMERKLDPDKVMEMKRLLYLGETQPNIAEKFGVTQTMVSLVHRRKRWRHIVFHPTRQDRRIRERIKKTIGKQIA